MSGRGRFAKALVVVSGLLLLFSVSMLGNATQTSSCTTALLVIDV